MCRRVLCEQCEKVSYAGCGKHLEQVFRSVAIDDRCRCRELAAARKLTVSPVSPVARVALQDSIAAAVH